MSKIYVRIDDETRHRVVRQADREGRNMSNMVVWMIKHYLLEFWPPGKEVKPNGKKKG